MKTADQQHTMAGIPSAAPGSAEGTENIDDQSKTPMSAHTPGSAEGEDLPGYNGEGTPPLTDKA